LPREAFAAYFRDYAAFDKERWVPAIACPVLLLLADEARLPDDAQRAFIRAAAKSYQQLAEQATIRSIPGSLHLMMVTSPEETVKEILAFLTD
jgi:pimeloyl-ACP methyl ester carboxylesterase